MDWPIGSNAGILKKEKSYNLLSVTVYLEVLKRKFNSNEYKLQKFYEEGVSSIYHVQNKCLTLLTFFAKVLSSPEEKNLRYLSKRTMFQCKNGFLLFVN